MSNTRIEIFIASRFEEFKELRSLLREKINGFKTLNLEAIDFNDGRVSARPPIENCVFAVKRAEVMILLVGETYGGSPPGETLSYTHLEYKAAMATSSSTTVVPFFIGPSYGNNNFKFSDDKSLAAWQKEIIDNHTPGLYESSEDLQNISELIFQWSLKPILDIRTVNLCDLSMKQPPDLSDSEQEDDESDSSVSDLTYLSDGELDYLEGDFLGNGTFVFENEKAKYPDIISVLRKPAEIAALEQIEEAQKAICLGDRGTAILHYRKALDHRPLDMKTTYSLAKLLMVSGKKSECREAIFLALKSADMALFDTRNLRASECYMLAARAAAKVGAFEESIGYAKKAIDSTPWLAAAHLEMACQFANKNDLKEAYKEIKIAFRIHPKSLLKLKNEIAFLKNETFANLCEKLSNELVRNICDIKKCFTKYTSLRTETIDSTYIAQNELIVSNYHNHKDPITLLNSGKRIVNFYLEELQKEACNIVSNLDAQTKKIQNYKKICHYDDIEVKYYKKIYINETFPDNNLPVEIVSILVEPWHYVVKGTPIISYLVRHESGDAKINRLVADSSGVITEYNVNKYPFYAYMKVCDIDLEDVTENNELNQIIQEYCSSVLKYENLISNYNIFMPGKKLKNCSVGDIVKIDFDYIRERNDISFEEGLLPESLKIYTGEFGLFENNNRFRLYRVVSSMDGKVNLSRSAVYFSESADSYHFG